MKRILIFYVILTLITLIAFITPRYIPPTDEEIEIYKQELLLRSPNLTEEELLKSVNSYLEADREIHTHAGMDFWSAFKLSAILSAVVIIGFIILYYLRITYFNQVYGETKYGKMGDIHRFFFGKPFD